MAKTTGRTFSFASVSRPFLDASRGPDRRCRRAVRSLEDHSLMPNIEAGEIGPKVHGGMAAVDNGCELPESSSAAKS